MEKIIQFRTANPKRFAVSTIAVLYENLQKRVSDRRSYEQGKITRNGFTPISDKELDEMTMQLRERVEFCVRHYGITQQDIDGYSMPMKIRITN